MQLKVEITFSSTPFGNLSNYRTPSERSAALMPQKANPFVVATIAVPHVGLRGLPLQAVARPKNVLYVLVIFDRVAAPAASAPKVGVK